MKAEMLDLPEANDGDYPAGNTLDFEVHAGETGNYSLELAYVTSKYSEAAMQKLAESIDEMLLCLQDDSRSRVADFVKYQGNKYSLDLATRSAPCPINCLNRHAGY